MRPVRLAVAIALVSVTLTLPGCGKGSSVEHPEVVTPRPPNGLEVGPADAGPNPRAPVAPEVAL